MFHLDVNDDVKANTKVTVERLVSSLLTVNLCRHNFSLMVCLHIHCVYLILSQGEHARIFF